MGRRLNHCSDGPWPSKAPFLWWGSGATMSRTKMELFHLPTSALGEVATMPSRSLVLLSYGSRDEQVAETKYAVLSAYRLLRPSDDIEVVLYTDNPSSFDDMPVRLRPIAKEELAAWAGPSGYPYRRKLEVLRDALNQTGHPVVFVDSDTWFRKSPVRLFQRIGRGKSLMHVREGSLRNAKGPPDWREFIESAQRRTWMTSSGSPLTISSDVMWNSGVIGLDRVNSVLVEDALALVDQVKSSECDLWCIEQFAVGYLLMCNTELAAAFDVVFHYWPPPFRKAFHPTLLREMDLAADLAVKVRAEQLHHCRPRLHGAAQVKHAIKQAYRLTGREWLTPGNAS